MEGRNFHQERDGSKGGFRKPFLPTVPLTASPRLTSFPSSPRGGGGRRIFRRLMSAAPHSPPPKSNSPFPSLGRMRNPPINQVATDRPDPKWIGIQHSVETFFTTGGFKRAQIGEFHRLILLSPFNSAGQAKGEGRVAFKGKRPPPSLFPSSPPPLLLPPLFVRDGKKALYLRHEKKEGTRRKKATQTICAQIVHRGGKGKFFE